MLNYEVDASLLLPFVPSGTELDRWNGKVFVSLVGFRFLKTKLLGFLPIPLHSNFDEVNLRFYVRRQEGDEIRRGVVFVTGDCSALGDRLCRTHFLQRKLLCLPMAHEIRPMAMA